MKRIIANDLSLSAVKNIQANVLLNDAKDLVETNRGEASLAMHQLRSMRVQVDAIDLDPYGCAGPFLDSAVQTVRPGGLLLVTATDMAVLAGNSPETCHAKYGSVPLRGKFCHEMALRILLRAIEARANVYGRYIEPLLSVSVDFYVRVFVRVCYGPKQCKSTTSKLALVHVCSGCASWSLQPLGEVRKQLPVKNSRPKQSFDEAHEEPQFKNLRADHSLEGAPMQHLEMTRVDLQLKISKLEQAFDEVEKTELNNSRVNKVIDELSARQEDQQVRNSKLVAESQCKSQSEQLHLKNLSSKLPAEDICLEAQHYKQPQLENELNMLESVEFQSKNLSSNQPKLKYSLPAGPAVGPKCTHCGSNHRTGGPIWIGPLHDTRFVHEMLTCAPAHLLTRRRLEGLLTVVMEELMDVPLYYALEHLSGSLRCETPPLASIRSALLNSGWRVSGSHALRTAVKTDAPSAAVWAVMRAWEAAHPARRERLSAHALHLLEPRTDDPPVDWTMHSGARSFPHGLLRFQQNPRPHWGPGSRHTNMACASTHERATSRQNKRKRHHPSTDTL